MPPSLDDFQTVLNDRSYGLGFWLGGGRQRVEWAGCICMGKEAWSTDYRMLAESRGR